MSSGSKIRFGELPNNFDFVRNEKDILKYWEKIDAFKLSLKQSAGKPRYSFYDGPPFATGLPHYGHILTGTIKDTVTRYAHQNGFHVDRCFGWDCHGLPIEYEIDKKLNIKGPWDVVEMGIDKYNQECRGIVDRYSNEWETIVTRLGRWIDFENDYKTMYPSFMESVWWVSKQLFEKKMIYHGYKVMPYSTACSSPLSNFEANQNYKDVVDPSVVVSFPLESDPSVSFLAWTTTPWTLVSNLGLVVNPKLIYVKLREKSTGKVYILMESRVNAHFAKKPHEILEKFEGNKLKGLTYIPCFDCFQDWKENGAFRVLTDNYVSDSDGTGIVHCAPAFGEDDFRVCIANGIYRDNKMVPCPINETGLFTNEIEFLNGQYFKDADKLVMKELKLKKRVFLESTVKHNYPFCWRSDTPLMYKLVPSWFVNVESVIPKLLANNSKTYWVPDFVKEKRFHNWLENARDWNISRNRYWGTPIPLWVDKDYKEIICIGSIDELYELSGIRVTDLHRESIDHIKIPSKMNPGTYLSRVSEVFDCWFESGSMPYAQIHYPFENKLKFEESFPADFIAEGVDQTRGWFYTLMVISTILFDKPPFKNLIVNGLVLASDGQKMSKRKQNYPPPTTIIDKYGADAIRLYLINSPVVRGDFLKFQESGVHSLLKDLFILFYNTFRYFIQNVHLMEKNTNKKFIFDKASISNVENYMDKWILSYMQSLINFIHIEMKAYRLYTVVPAIKSFIESLSKWYIRFNKFRFKGDMGAEEQLVSLSTLYHVFYKSSVMFAPFIPFMTEYIYQNLLEFKKESALDKEFESSVHFQMLPETKCDFVDEKVENCVKNMQDVIDLARIIRERNTVPTKNPLKELIVINTDESALKDVKSLEKYILEDLNIYKLTVSNDMGAYGVQCSIQPDFQALGRKMKSHMKTITEQLKAMTLEDYNKNKNNDTIVVADQVIHESELKFTYSVNNNSNCSAYSNGKFVVILDLTQDDSLKDIYIARELCKRFQQLRKKAKVVPTDDIVLTCWGDEKSRVVVEKHMEFICSVVRKPIIMSNDHSELPNKLLEVSEKVGDLDLQFAIFLKS